MLLGKNAEFFRQKEKPLGLIKPTEGGDGGLHENEAMALPGLRQVFVLSIKANADQG